MQNKPFLTLAALSATLLPVSVALAQDTNTSGTTMSTTTSTMEVGEFRDRLSGLRNVLKKMQENSNLAMAAQSVVEQGRYTENNRHLLHRALGITDEVTANWRRIDTPEINVQQMGSRDMARFAAESEDTAFVRNTVWQIQSQLQSAKLNGRETNVVSRQMMEMLDAAIARAGNANFRVANASNRWESRMSRIEWRDLGEATTPAPASGEAVASASREWKEVTIEHENLPARNQVAMADTTVEETMTETPAPAASERIGSANLPQTGGDPGSLVLFGSSLIGAGGFLLRRKRR